MLSLVHLTLSALLLVSGALTTTATLLESAIDSSDFSESPSSQFESTEPSSAFFSSQSLASAGDGVDHASAFTIFPQSSSNSDDGFDRASSTNLPNSSITSSLPVSNTDPTEPSANPLPVSSTDPTEPSANPPSSTSDSPTSSLSSQPPASSPDGIDHASAITIFPETTSTTADGIDHASAVTMLPPTTTTADGIDRASAVTLSPKTSSTSTSTSNKPTSTSTRFVTPPPVFTTVTVPPPFSNTLSLSQTESTAPPDPSPTDNIGIGYTRFCPWCHPSIPASEGKGECNFVMQHSHSQPEPQTARAGKKGEKFPWAILNADFSVLLDGGLAGWDTAVVVSLSGGGEGVGRVQMSGNRFWVTGGGGGEMGPHLVYNDLDMPPTHHGWREYTFAAPGQGGGGNVTVKRISFDCSQSVTCEFGGRFHEEL